MKEKNNKIKWLCLPFADLSLDQLYDALSLRVNVFVVEQKCVYHELDEKDRNKACYHLLGYLEGQLVAYARLLAPGLSYTNVSFGRVVTHAGHRGGGLGDSLLGEILSHCQRLWPNQSIDIGAQDYLQAFYAKYSFMPISEVYDEDGIPHLDMRLDKKSTSLS